MARLRPGHRHVTPRQDEWFRQVRGQGGRKTIGELVTCPFCTGVGSATAFTAGLVYLPRTTRLATATLTALAGADLLQFAHALLEQAAEQEK